ncbi:hypothetical protein TTHERM_000997699 (macronuclear) [Tetrahymena thermophila SB210]|uniref:Uncharacterized protein n=1 Tax=Tetrahymena thermophila (strain SB210) TaxID=312017 RepID=W7XIT5_TETTS|nr:hypothetical protein TTHERM_000997699 [Tetrahymena thermophila SB210]EWS73594.1 hypothetical protein TTHERM_000997699 [Tetrahymena thermophila SB210]|eukprot:XP_012653876.1 hypothetical protein TTHERM_000997699 [Tetrahymena thermophila SB210]
MKNINYNFKKQKENTFQQKNSKLSFVFCQEVGIRFISIKSIKLNGFSKCQVIQFHEGCDFNVMLFNIFLQIRIYFFDSKHETHNASVRKICINNVDARKSSLAVLRIFCQKCFNLFNFSRVYQNTKCYSAIILIFNNFNRIIVQTSWHCKFEMFIHSFTNFIPDFTTFDIVYSLIEIKVLARTKILFLIINSDRTKNSIITQISQYSYYNNKDSSCYIQFFRHFQQVFFYQFLTYLYFF